MLQTPTERFLKCYQTRPFFGVVKRERSMLRNPEIVALIGLFGLSTVFGATFFFLKTINFQKFSRK